MTERTISRRDFIKLAGSGFLGIAAVGYIGWRNMGKLEEQFARLSLQGSVNAGMWNLNTNREVHTKAGLKTEIGKMTESLKGVDGSGLFVSKGGDNIFVGTGDYSDKFKAGSLVKLPLLVNVWNRGLREGVNYVTPEAADKILGKSEHSGEFIMSLPWNSNKKPEELGNVIEDMLTEEGIPPEFSKSGHINIGHMDYYRYLRTHEFPPVIMDAMKQTEADDKNNYGVSKVLRSNTSAEEDSYFKIGLAEENGVLTNSYVLMIGDVRAVGYARGSGVVDVHKQMLNASALVAKFSSVE